MNGFVEVYTREKGVNRDDRIHGSLLVLNELLRCSNTEWERTYLTLNANIYTQPQQQVIINCVYLLLKLQGLIHNN